MKLKKNRFILAFDFDDTIFSVHESGYPNIGEPNMALIRKAISDQRKGARLVLWTCRYGPLLQKAVLACEKKLLYFDSINDNVPNLGFDTSRKIYATYFIDDRAPGTIEWYLNTDFFAEEEG